MRVSWLLGIVFLVVTLFACSSETPPPTSPATVTLVPATVTPTPSATLMVQPSASAFDPSNLPTYTPAVTPILPENLSEMVNAALEDFAESTESETHNVLSLKRGLFNDCDESVNGFRVVLGNSEDAYVYVGTGADDFEHCPDASPFSSEGSPIAFDPILESLVELSSQNLASRLDLAVEDISWLDGIAVTWRESSLGCPVEGGNYVQGPIEGYRIALQAEEDVYVYHTDGIAIRFCPDGQERFPSPLASPEPTPTDEPTSTAEPTQ